MFPLSVDGIEIVASLVLLADKRAKRHAGRLPWAALIAGTCASFAANIAVGGSDWIGRAVSGWPAFALLIAVKLLFGLLEQPAIAEVVTQPLADQASASAAVQNIAPGAGTRRPRRMGGRRLGRPGRGHQLGRSCGRTGGPSANCGRAGAAGRTHEGIRADAAVHRGRLRIASSSSGRACEVDGAGKFSEPGRVGPSAAGRRTRRIEYASLRGTEGPTDRGPSRRRRIAVWSLVGHRATTPTHHGPIDRSASNEQSTA